MRSARHGATGSGSRSSFRARRAGRAAGRDPRWAPRRPGDFADFAFAASRRYPRVRLWMIWPRAHTPGELQAPDSRAARPPAHAEDEAGAAALLADPRRLLREPQAPQSRTTWSSAATRSPPGDVSPLNWIKNLRLPNGRPPRMDMYGHNPFSARRPFLNRPPLGHGFADFSDLDLLAGWVDRYLGRPRGRRGHEALPVRALLADRSPEPRVQLLGHAPDGRELARHALRVTRRWSRIYTLGWFSLYDDPPNAQGRRGAQGPAHRTAGARSRRTTPSSVASSRPAAAPGAGAAGARAPPRSGARSSDASRTGWRSPCWRFSASAPGSAPSRTASTT